MTEILEIFAQFKKSRLSLYALPWFMVLGPKSAGKTTLLNLSGLSLSRTVSVSENCTWYFSDKAVFIEVEWEIPKPEFLDLLAFIKKYRPRFPLNGIIFVMPFTSPNPAEEISKFRASFSDASDQLGYVIPVNLCVSYLETIQGFESYFKEAPENFFRSQDNNYAVLFSAVTRLAQSRQNLSEKLACLFFPEHFRQSEQSLKNWLQELGRTTPYQETPEVVAIYFTAPTVFIPGTVEQMINTSRVLQRKSRKHQWLSRWKMSASIVTVTVMVLVAFLVTSISFAHMTFKIHEGVRLGQMVSQSNNTDQNQALNNYLAHHPPAKLVPVLQTILLRRLEVSVMPAVFAHLENQLMLMQEQWALATTDEAEQMRGDYYNQLKTYLMFCYPQHRYPQFYQGNSLMAFYLNHSHQRWTARSDIVELSRQQLAVSPDVTNMYAGLQSWGEKQLGLVSASDLFGKSLDGSVVIPKFFTMRGFAVYAMPEIERLKSDWVMQESTEGVKDNLLRLYKAAYKQAWINFLQQLRPAVGEAVTDKTVRKIMAVAHQNILFKTADKNGDPQLNSAIQNIMLLPQMTKIMTEINAAWNSQVYDFYRRKLADKYPFSDSPEDVDSADFHAFFDMPQGIFWQFIHQYSNGENDEKNKINFSPEFAKTVIQAKAFASPFVFQIYPEPTPGLKEIRLVINSQSYRYRNDPQEWQAMQWRVQDNHDESALEIITSSGAEGVIEFDSPWGFFRLLQKAELMKQDDEIFRATWKIRADNGKTYAVNFLFKCTEPENLFGTKFTLNAPFSSPLPLSGEGNL